MTIKLIQTKKTTLVYGINDSATTMRLTNLLKLDGTAMSASDIGDALTGTFDPGTSREEIFSIASGNVTVNSDGTVDITSVTRGLQEVDPYTTGGFATDHPAGAVVVFGNNPQVYDKFGRKADANTWASLQTFTVLPRSNGGNATADTELITYAQAVAMATGTTAINRIVVAGNGGEVITAGQLLYLLVTDGEWYKADADTASQVDNIILGIAQGAGTDGGAITNGVLLFGLDSNQTGLTTNTAYYASNTAGGISSTPGTTEVSVGISRSTTSLLFYPRYNQELTENQQDALAGDLGTPSATNLYATQLGLQKNAEKYGASAAGSDTYAVTLSPAPTEYNNGRHYFFKADVANTGPATLDINGLGAISLVTALGTALVTGDIVANQIVEVIYNSTGPVFQVVNPASAVLTATTYTNGTDTKNAADASGTQNIAHGLGKIPKKVKVNAMLAGTAQAGGSTSSLSLAMAVYNGTTQSSISNYQANAGSGIYATDNTFTLNLASGGDNRQVGVVTFDSTNIIITWTKNNSPTGIYILLWEAQA